MLLPHLPLPPILVLVVWMDLSTQLPIIFANPPQPQWNSVQNIWTMQEGVSLVPMDFIWIIAFVNLIDLSPIASRIREPLNILAPLVILVMS